jgi:hypothetical protein
VDERAQGGAKVDPTFGVHALQSFSDGLPADPERIGQILLDQMLTRLQLASDYHLDEGLEDCLAQRCGTLDNRPPFSRRPAVEGGGRG